MPASLAAFSTAAQPPRTIRSASETFLPLIAVRLRAVELLLYLFERLQHFCEIRRIVHFPILLRGKTNARAIGAAALIGTAEGRCRRPGSRNELRYGKSRRENFRLQSCDIRLADQRMIHGRNRVLPDQLFFGHERAEIARDRSHIAVRQLEPGTRECVRELIRMLVETPRNLSRRSGRSEGRDRSSASSAHASWKDRARPGS